MRTAATIMGDRPSRSPMVGLLVGAIVLSFGCRGSSAVRVPEGPWIERFEGVKIAARVLAEPRPLRIHVVQLDLRRGAKLQPTSPNGPRPLEVDGETTLEFARRRKCRVAVNASPFRPVEQAPGAPKDVVGIAVRDGIVYSSPERKFGALAITEDGRARIVAPPIRRERLQGLRHVIGGFELLRTAGRDVSNRFVRRGRRNPRTAVGVSSDGQTLWFVVVDGRQRRYSEGVTLPELSQIMASLGATEALNLDGGGSSTLVVAGPSGYRVVNSPIHGGEPGTARVVGSNICIFAQSLAEP